MTTQSDGMNTKTFTILASALLSTLRQSDAPSGTVYVAFMTKGISYDDYISLVDILKAQGLILDSKHNMLSLTPKGREFAAKIDAVMARKGESQ